MLLFSNEGSPREPVHIHAESSDGKAKFWFHPKATIARSAGFNRRQLSELTELVSRHRKKRGMG